MTWNNSLNPEKGKVFQIAAGKIMGIHFGVEFGQDIAIEIGHPQKAHRFDLVSHEDMKSYYRDFGDDLQTEAHPNAICGTYDAIEAKFGIPVLYTSRHRSLATEKAASWLSKHFTYWWLEQNGEDRTLIDSDGL